MRHHDKGFAVVEQEADKKWSPKHDCAYGVCPSLEMEADVVYNGVIEPAEGVNVGQAEVCWGPGRTRVRGVRGS
jgi:hypothetical protein